LIISSTSHTITPTKLIVIAGPTASGKTELAIQIAAQLGCPIISADSRQVYKELKIGVARPTEYQLSRVPHIAIASHSIFEPINAASYTAFIHRHLQLHPSQKVWVVCGGTGLYIHALLYGLDPQPQANPILRAELQELYDKGGIQALQRQLQQVDPDFYALAEWNNPHRLMRNIEIARSTGQSNLEFRTQKSKPLSGLDPVCFCLHPPRELLYHRIRLRVEQMLADGLLHEVEQLLPFKHLQALQTVGYQELFAYLDGLITEKQAIDDMCKNTRRYAKRQVTWFKNKGNFIPITSTNPMEDIMPYIHNHLSSLP
jgi:tRNA dimethylallyltransferase